MKNFMRILLLAAILMLPAYSFAAQAGKVEIVIGTSQELEDGQFDWELLKVADPVMVKSIVRTLKKSKLKLSLLDGSFLLLTESSKAKIEDIAPKGKSFLKMFTGKVRAIVKKVISPASTFTITTQTAVIGVKGTDFLVILSKDLTEVICISGIITVSNILEDIIKEVEVRPNHYTKVSRFNAPTDPVELSPDDINDRIYMYGLSETALLEDFEETESRDIVVEKEIDEDDIEGTTEDDVEIPEDTLGGVEDFGGVDVNEEIVVVPEIEDTDTGNTISNPPNPPPF